MPLRVIAGAAGGRRLVAPKGGTRPTTDRVKEALFASLGHRIDDAAVLDLYAGSGALAIEALSRGAARAVLVDRDAAAEVAVRANLSTTGFDAVATFVRSPVERFLARPTRRRARSISCSSTRPTTSRRPRSRPCWSSCAGRRG